MREYFTLHRSVFPSYLTIESGRMCVILQTLCNDLLVTSTLKKTGYMNHQNRRKKKYW